MRTLLLGLIVLGLAARPAAACKDVLDYANKTAGEIVGWTAERSQSEVKAKIAELSHVVSNVRGCIGQLAAGSERTTLEGAYAALQAKITKVQAASAQLAKVYAIEKDVRALVTKIKYAAPGTDFKAEIDALQQRIAAFAGPQASAAWRSHVNARFEEVLERHVRARASQAASAEVDRIQKNTVMARHGFTSDDAFRLDKVVQAFEQATPTDLVVTRAANRASFSPSSAEPPSMGAFDTDVSLHPKRDDRVHTAVGARAVRIRETGGYKPLPAGLPALVWEVAGGRTIFVTVDGGRYEDSGQPLEAGTPAAASWPAAPIATMLYHGDIAKLGELGVVDARAAKAVAAAHAAYRTCADRIWKSHDRAFDAIAAANITTRAANARKAQLETKVVASVLARCRSHAVRFDNAWQPIAKRYAAQRAETLAKVRALLSR